jgi:hypothetical protein
MVDSHAYVQRLVSVVNMATVLECYTEEQRSVVHSLWAKELTAKDIHKYIFSVYSGKCLSRKAVHNCVEKHGKRSTDDKEVETEVRKCLRQQSKDFSAAGFDDLVKRWDKCVNASYVLYFISIRDLFTDSPSYLKRILKKRGVRIWTGLNSPTEDQRKPRNSLLLDMNFSER